MLYSRQVDDESASELIVMQLGQTSMEFGSSMIRILHPLTLVVAQERATGGIWENPKSSSRHGIEGGSNNGYKQQGKHDDQLVDFDFQLVLNQAERALKLQKGKQMMGTRATAEERERRREV